MKERLPVYYEEDRNKKIFYTIIEWADKNGVHLRDCKGARHGRRLDITLGMYASEFSRKEGKKRVKIDV